MNTSYEALQRKNAELTRKLAEQQAAELRDDMRRWWDKCDEELSAHKE